MVGRFAFGITLFVGTGRCLSNRGIAVLGKILCACLISYPLRLPTAENIRNICSKCKTIDTAVTREGCDRSCHLAKT